MSGSYRFDRPVDRLLDVHGPEGYSALSRLLAGVLGNFFEPTAVWVIGREENVYDLSQSVRKRNVSDDQLSRLLTVAPVSKDEATEIPFSFASEDQTRALIKKVQEGYLHEQDGKSNHYPIRTIVSLYLSEETPQDRYLPLFLQCCPDVKVYCVRDMLYWGFEHDPGIFPRTDLQGYEAVPLSVDLDAEVGDEEILTSIPREALFGKLGEIAKSIRCPLGYSYPATLAAASVFVTGNHNVRSSLYVALVGNVHTGKSVALERVGRLLFPTGSNLLVEKVPASDRGLFKIFGGDEFKKRFLSVDEGRTMMSKGNIENSTLISVLCALWSRNRQGTADRSGQEETNVELSIAMNLKVKDESEFPSVFTHATSHGLYDRCLFGVRGDEKWHFTQWDFDEKRDLIRLEPTQPAVHGWIFDRAHAWAAAGEDRERLAEIALRVAYITSAADRLPEVSMESLDAALKLVEWQESLRAAYQPAKGANESQECMAAVLDEFQKAPGHALNWRDVCRKKNWYRRFPRTLSAIKRTLEKDGVLRFDKQSKKHYLNEEKQP